METVLITGISGEVGYGLVKKLIALGNFQIIALDIKHPEPEILKLLTKFYTTDITDKEGVDSIFKQHKIDVVFHLASILSTGGEKNPELASDINITGTLNLLKAATKNGLEKNKSIKFIFPSSIAAHGNPITIYGISKLACENIGIYFSTNYKLLDTTINRNNLVDFRSVRFPGLLSPDTLPSGGTSDYGSEMIHSAAQKIPYDCFVRPDTTIPFMAMSDAVEILMTLLFTPKINLSQQIYEIGGFSVSAKEIEKEVKKHFPNSIVNYKINNERQKIVDSWPKAIDSSKAVKDWGYKIKYDFTKTFSDYLIPKIKSRYK